MYDAGLAARLDDIMAGMLEIDVTRMFGGYGFLMNGHMCVFIWGDRLLSGLVRLRQTQLPTSRMLVRWI